MGGWSDSSGRISGTKSSAHSACPHAFSSGTGAGSHTLRDTGSSTQEAPTAMPEQETQKQESKLVPFCKGTFYDDSTAAASPEFSELLHPETERPGVGPAWQLSVPLQARGTCLVMASGASASRPHLGSLCCLSREWMFPKCSTHSPSSPDTVTQVECSLHMHDSAHDTGEFIYISQ